QSTVAGDKKSATAGTAVNTPAGGVGQELKMKPKDDEQRKRHILTVLTIWSG
ncbi:TPA: hypothetical protein OTY66_003920, partial [Salmonella enterica]|nr:hypothetical protein [Salmonella enterica]